MLDVGEVLPFSNSLKVYQLTGSQIKSLLDFGNNNQRFGWLQTGNLQVKMSPQHNLTEQMTYVSPLHKQVPLELNKKYYLVADEFITTGGDGYSPQFFPTQQEVKVEGMPSTTDAFVQYLKSCPCIPTSTELSKPQ